MNRTLSMAGKKNITIRGKGVGKTVLSFKTQTSGAEGIRISNGENITLEDISVQDAKGDGIKVMDVRGINFRRVRAEWTCKLSKKEWFVCYLSGPQRKCTDSTIHRQRGI